MDKIATLCAKCTKECKQINCKVIKCPNYKPIIK